MEMETHHCMEYSAENPLAIDEKHVAALVDFVLIKASEEVWIGDADNSNLAEIPRNLQSSKSTMPKAKKLFCVERNVEGQDDWEIIEYSPEDFERDFVQAGDGGSTNNLPVKQLDNSPHMTGEKLTNTTTEMPMRLQNRPRQMSTQTDENTLKKAVRLYLQEIITRALRQICDEKPEVINTNPSEHRILFHSQSTDDLGETRTSSSGRFIPPRITIETVSDNRLPNMDGHGEDHLANDVVTVVLRSVVEDAQEETEHLDERSEIPNARRRSSVTLEILPESVSGDEDSNKMKILQRIPKLISVKRFIGFRRRNYTLHKKNKQPVPTIIVEDVDTNYKPVKDEDALKNAFHENSPTTVYVEKAQHVSLPPRKSQPFSRKIFSRLFGGKQYRPALSSVSSQDAHGQT